MDSNAKVYHRRNVEISADAIDESSAETFTTNSGKLLHVDGGDNFPTFTKVPIVVPIKSQGFEVQVVRDSETLVDGNCQFRAFIGSVGAPPTDGRYLVDYVFVLN